MTLNMQEQSARYHTYKASNTTNRREVKWAAKDCVLKFWTRLNGSKENCTFSKTHINEVIRFLANTARYSPPTFFTMESTKYKTGSFSVDGAWSNRKLNKFRKQQGLKPTFQNKYNLTGVTGPTAPPGHPLCENSKQKLWKKPTKGCVKGEKWKTWHIQKKTEGKSSNKIFLPLESK